VGEPVKRPREAKPKRPPRPRRPRITYRVEILPGGDPERGEELLLRWLADVLSE
jgi:hypothetical protein